MLKSRILFALALSVPVVAAAIPAHAQKKGGGSDAARAECFRQAQEAANAVMEMAEKNTRGASAYRACARKAGIKP